MAEFKLPHGWYRSTITRLVREELPPLLGPLTIETAWRYVYACVLWSEMPGGERHLHLNDQLSKKSGKAVAKAGYQYLLKNLVEGPNCEPFDIIDSVGRAYADERVRQGHRTPQKRDQNVTGAAFETTLQVLIGELCKVLPDRTPLLSTLRGFELSPQGYHSRPDLALFGARDFQLLISTKWTLRKERIGSYLHEAYFYKQRRSDLQIAFVVSEFNPSILSWLANDPLVDRVYHVNLPMLLSVRDPFPALNPGESVAKSKLLGRSRDIANYHRWLTLRERVFDLSQLFADINLLRGVGVESLPDPEDEEAPEAEDSDEP